MDFQQGMYGLREVEIDWAALVKEQGRTTRITEHHLILKDAPNYLTYSSQQPLQHHRNIPYAPSMCPALCLVETRLDKAKSVSTLVKLISRIDNKQRSK